MTIQFFVPGKPMAKQRPRAVRIGQFARMYTPKETAVYENQVRMIGANAMNGQAIIDAPVSLTLSIRLPMPRSWSKKRMAEAASGLIAATKKPDMDNVIKAVKDALNGVVWRDDSLVVRATIEKCYAVEPGVQVQIETLEIRSAP